MRRVLLFGVDFFLVALASVLALFLRENFETSSDRLIAYLPHLAATLAVAALVIPLFRLNRSVWRFTAMRDYLFILGATALIVWGAVMVSFSINRLEGVPRSVPLIQALLILVLLVGARVLMRVRHAARRMPVAQFTAVEAADGFNKPAILIIGLNRLTELYLQSAQELNPGGVRVAGLVGRNERHTGRLMHRHPVLGVPEDLPDILKTLQVHGVMVDRILVTATAESLGDEAKKVLRDIEDGSDIRVEFLAQSLGFETRPTSPSLAAASPREPKVERSLLEDVLAIDGEEQTRLKARGYWRLKRVLDALGALVLIVLLAPVFVIAAVLVAIDIGAPVLFWQQRPGLGGRPFKLYKFRTMGPAHDAGGRLRLDAERLSAIGRFLRRSRLDELPQLVHILVGQMSFVGPRPLLPVDQPVGAAARLLVRPGLTGWAQVKGGRLVSSADKAALDVWYVRNASFWLDVEILWRTVEMVIFGEKPHRDAILKAWAELAGSDPFVVDKAEPVPRLAVVRKRAAGRRAA